MGLSDFVELVLSVTVFGWCICRAYKYMSRQTALVDQVFIVAMGTGAAAHALLPINRILWLLTGRSIEVDQMVLLLAGPVFWTGLAGWLVMPNVRKMIREHWGVHA